MRETYELRQANQFSYFTGHEVTWGYQHLFDDEEGGAQETTRLIGLRTKHGDFSEQTCSTVGS